MDKWEQEEFDKKSTAEVALELHMLRVEAGKVSEVASALHSEAYRLQRLYEVAEQKSQDAAYDVQIADKRVREVEQYLNKRVGA